MTPSWFYLFGLFLVFLSGERGLAQQADAPPSEPFFQKRAPDFSSWTITPDSSDDSGTKDPATDKTAASTRIVKTRDILLQEQTDASGQKWDYWCLQGLQITVFPNQTQWVPGPPNIEPTLSADYSVSDFPDLTWITSAAYTGLDSFKNQKCLHFEGVIVVQARAVGDQGDTPPPPPPPPIPVSAWIDPDTRLPVEIKKGDRLYHFSFQAPPTGMLTPPPLIQSLLDEQRKSIELATPHAAKP